MSSLEPIYLLPQNVHSSPLPFSSYPKAYDSLKGNVQLVCIVALFLLMVKPIPKLLSGPTLTLLAWL